MQIVKRFVWLIIALLTVAGGSAAAADWRAKVDPWVWDELSRHGAADVLVVMADQAALAGVDRLPVKAEKGRAVYARLTAVAEADQASLRELFDRAGVAYRPFWIVNMIQVEVDAAMVARIAARADVARIAANPSFPLDRTLGRVDAPGPQGVEWNVTLINADDVWADGVTGAGAVVAGADTGYAWQHPALKAAYRGWDGASADHSYSWYDAITSGNGGSCGVASPEPCDDWGHGSHTMGTMVGNDLAQDDAGWPGAAVNAIGVAPGARWIGCRNMDVGIGSPATYAACYEWFIAPTDADGLNPDPARAPDVINNSWSCPTSEGCTDPLVLQTVVENVRAAGIVTVHSAGNDGGACGTVSKPAAIYDASFAVGATDAADSIAGFSSRGPVTVDGSNRRKPDVSAPGVNVRSSGRFDNYYGSSGTSMAAPHVAGVIALIIDARPDLAGDVDTLEWIVEQSAVGLATTQNCGDIPGDQIPNNTFGYGRIDALAAVALAQSLPGDTLYVSVADGGVVGGVTLEPHDVARFEWATDAWSVYFDGAAHGLDGADINGVVVLDDGRIALTFAATVDVPGVGVVPAQDIVLYRPMSGDFVRLFDGSDVGLTTADEALDALGVLANGDLVISTRGAFSVPGVSGVGQDLVRFTAAQWGGATAGSWSMYQAGAPIGLGAPPENVWGVAFAGAGDDVYATTAGALSIGPLSADGADIVFCLRQAIAGGCHEYGVYIGLEPALTVNAVHVERPPAGKR